MSSLTGARQTVLVGSRLDSKDNLIAVAWHMPVSMNPFMYAVAIGKTRYSAELIQKTKVFCINFVSFKQKDEVLFCGRNSGKDVDKFEEAKIRKEECSVIDCARMKDCLAFLECQLTETIEAGDHYIFIGEVVNHKELKNEKRLYHIGDDNFTTTLYP